MERRPPSTTTDLMIMFPTAWCLWEESGSSPWWGGKRRWRQETQGEEFLCPWSEEEDEEEDKEQEGWNCVGLIFPWVWQLLCLPRCPVIAAMANCWANRTPEEQTWSHRQPNTAHYPDIGSMDHARIYSIYAFYFGITLLPTFVFYIPSRQPFFHMGYSAVRKVTFQMNLCFTWKHNLQTLLWLLLTSTVVLTLPQHPFILAPVYTQCISARVVHLSFNQYNSQWHNFLCFTHITVSQIRVTFVTVVTWILDGLQRL